MPTVETTSGLLEGTEESGIRVFRGVPYARPPVGELRLRPPQRLQPWSGVRQARDYGLWAPQNIAESPIAAVVPSAQGEDCLTLNVWTPGTDGTRRPVMVWVHGGAFTGGSGASPLYAGSRLSARGDVVVVTVNYRIGILGFVAHSGLADDAGAPQGNWGLLDQVAALEWVRDNIAAFGGDPANVTVFGESAGGMSVADLMTMPSARGLFRQAIVQSGPPTATTMDRAEEHTTKLLAELGLSHPSALRSAPVGVLLAAQASVLIPKPGGGLTLVPVVDGVSLPASPLDGFREGSAAPVPLLIGTNRDEAKLFMVADPKNRDPDEEVLRSRIDRAFTANDVPLRADDAIDAYRAARGARGDGTAPRELWSAIESDRMFRIGSLEAAVGHARRQLATFCYLFEWESPAMHGALGACHALEIPFVLGNLDVPGMDRFAGSGPRASALSEQMMDAWLAFARSGDPRHPGIPDWPAYEGEHRSTMVLGADTRVLEAPMDEERSAWEAA